MQYLKKLIVVLVIVITCFSLGIVANADDNATGGDGDTSSAASGYGWYNSPEHLWKVSLYVGKSDTASKSSNLINDFYQVGNTHIYLKNTNWSLRSGTKFGAYNKVQYYNGTPLQYAANSPKIISTASCPKVPIACGGDIDTVKSYFGDTNTLNMILNAIADVKGTTQAGLVAGLNFTIQGATKVWDSKYILPNVSNGELQNCVPWVIIYEPVVVAHLKDKTTLLAFTATEFALAQQYGWYNFKPVGDNPQKIAKLTHQHLPTSVQLEFNWFGYPVYQVTDDSKVWTESAIIKGGGWGMRYLEAQDSPITSDFGVTYNAIPTIYENDSVIINITWKNYSSASYTDVPCSIYYDDELVWSGTYDFKGNNSIIKAFRITTGWGVQEHTIKAQINYANRYQETNPNNNELVREFTVAEYIDFAVMRLNVNKNDIYQGDTFRIEVGVVNNNEKKTYEDISLELLFGNTIMKTTTVDLEPNKNYYFYFYITDPTFVGEKNITARINWANRLEERNIINNSKSLSMNIKKYYDFSATDLLLSDTSVLESDQISVTCKIDNWDPYNSYQQIPIELIYDGEVLAVIREDFTAYASKTVQFKLNVGSAGKKAVQVRVNWPDKDAEEITTNNITEEQVVTINPNFDLSISVIEPNADYRAGTTVITSFYVHNNSARHVTPANYANVTFNVYYLSGLSRIDLIEQTAEKIVIPANEKNIVYFKWDVPQDFSAASVFYYAEIDSPVAETGYANNMVGYSNSVINVQSDVPNPDFSLERPQDWYDVTSAPKNLKITKQVEWYEWVCESSKFVKKEYQISTKFGNNNWITAAETNPTAYYRGGRLYTKSGYGLSFSYKPGYTVIGKNAVITGYQHAEVYYPEFNYSNETGKYSTLELLDGYFVLKENQDSIDNERVHFIPMWKSNGSYYIQIYASDFWTPVGMIAHSISTYVVVDGSLYDDYYTSRD